MTNENDVLQSGIAVLAADEPRLINGVAIGENETTTGLSGKATFWPPDVLREAAELLEGVPIVRNHPGVTRDADGLSVDGQPPVESQVGEVTSARYEPGVGLLWQGELDEGHSDITQQIENGRADVSPVVARSLGEFDESREAYPVESIDGFRDLGIVSVGASRAASVDFGPAATPTAAAMSADALARAFAPSDSDETSDKERDTNMSNKNEYIDNDELNERIEALEEENREMKAVFCRGIAPETPFSAEVLADRFEFTELVDTFAEDGTGEALIADPRSSASGSTTDEDDGRTGVEALSVDERERYDRLKTRREALANVASQDRLESIDAEIESLVGSTD